jgi:hypothetical protein
MASTETDLPSTSMAMSTRLQSSTKGADNGSLPGCDGGDGTIPNAPD